MVTSEDWLEMSMNILCRKKGCVLCLDVEDGPRVVHIREKSLSCTVKIYAFCHM